MISNSHLETLDLAYNSVMSKASMVFGRSLMSNGTLTYLDLSGNPLGEAGARSILRSSLRRPTCNVVMNNCLFSDTQVMFDRACPQAKLEYDLDLKVPYEACLMYELCMLAKEWPGCKFQSVCYSLGGQSGKVFLNLQCVEGTGVVDGSTGKPWEIPSMGTLSVVFLTHRSLPKLQDGLSEASRAKAVQVIKAADTTMGMRSMLFLISQDIFLTTSGADELLEEMVRLGLTAMEVVERLWTCIIDVENLYAFLCRHIDKLHRGGVVKMLSPELSKFNWKNPTGHYCLQLSQPSHRHILGILRAVHSNEIKEIKAKHQLDTSQHQDWSMFRNATLNCSPITVLAMDLEGTREGTLEFDYVSVERPPTDAVIVDDDEVDRLQHGLDIEQRDQFAAQPNYQLAVLQLQLAVTQHYFTCNQAITIVDCFEHSRCQISAVCALFGRVVDLGNFNKVIDTLPANKAQEVCHRLGYLNVLNPMKLSRTYRLDLEKADERKLCKMLLQLAPGEKGDNMKVDEASDLTLLDLYGAIGRLADDVRSDVVLLKYAAIGERGNIPNWPLRLSILPHFLCDSKPVQDEFAQLIKSVKDVKG
ncbi:unnamed protein product [Chrysoparadoxa australica]